LLILGIFAMLYVRERRLWVWLAPGAGQNSESGAKSESGSRATMAMSTNRQTMDGGQEFEMLTTKLLQVPR
jgi:cytochrome c biogenesis protein